MKRTSTRPSRAQLNVSGRTFSVAYDKIDENKYEAICTKVSLTVQGSSQQQVLFNMQKALEYDTWSKGEVEGVRVSAW